MCPAQSWRALQRHPRVLPSVLTAVLEALQFEEVVGKYALLTGGEARYLKVVGGRGDCRRPGQVVGC